MKLKILNKAKRTTNVKINSRKDSRLTTLKFWRDVCRVYVGF